MQLFKLATKILQLGTITRQLSVKRAHKQFFFPIAGPGLERSFSTARIRVDTYSY